MPTSRRINNMIMGGLPISNDSVRSLKEYERKAITIQKWPCAIDKDAPIIFEEANTDGLNKPYNDPLVIGFMIIDCEVMRKLVDTESSVDLIFKEKLKKMEIKDTEIKLVVRPLTGFTSEATMTVGTIKLPVYVRGITKLVKFVVVDKLAVYNVIMGTPWMHSMKAVPSTYH